MVKNDASKIRRHLKDGEKRLHAEIMADDKKTQNRIDKQFERQNVSEYSRNSFLHALSFFSYPTVSWTRLSSSQKFSRA